MYAVRVAMFRGLSDHVVEGTDGKLYYVRSNGYLHEIFSLEFQSRRIKRVANLYIDQDYLGVDGRNGYFMLRRAYNSSPVFILEVPGYRLIRFDDNVVDYNVDKQCAFCVGSKHYVAISDTRRYLNGRVMCFNADRCIYAAIDDNAVIIADALTNEVKCILPGALAANRAVIYPVSERYCVRLLDDAVDLICDGKLIERVTVQDVDYSSVVNSRGDSCIIRSCRDKSLYIDFSREPPVIVFSLCSIYRLTKKGIFCQCGHWHTIFIDTDELHTANRKCLFTSIVDSVRFPIYRSVVYTPTEISP